MYNPFSLEGKTVLVTGASSGIGRAVAIECSRMGARVYITARNEARLKETLELLEGDGHEMIIADLSDLSQLDYIVEHVGHLDGLVNNAGYAVVMPTSFITKEKLQDILLINTIAPILLTQKLLKKKKVTRGASVVFTASISGPVVSGIGHAMYSTSKAAIGGFVKNAALDLASKNIRVNAVSPGMIETNMMNNNSITLEQYELDKKEYPLGRYGRPEEVAYAMIYLLSDASSFTTGTNLILDGGVTLR